MIEYKVNISAQPNTLSKRKVFDCTTIDESKWKFSPTIEEAETIVSVHSSHHAPSGNVRTVFY